MHKKVSQSVNELSSDRPLVNYESIGQNMIFIHPSIIQITMKNKKMRSEVNYLQLALLEGDPVTDLMGPMAAITVAVLVVLAWVHLRQ